MASNAHSTALAANPHRFVHVPRQRPEIDVQSIQAFGWQRFAPSGVPTKAASSPTVAIIDRQWAANRRPQRNLLDHLDQAGNIAAIVKFLASDHGPAILPVKNRPDAARSRPLGLLKRRQQGKDSEADACSDEPGFQLRSST